jgi:hypothetical protein
VHSLPAHAAARRRLSGTVRRARARTCRAEHARAPLSDNKGRGVGPRTRGRRGGEGRSCVCGFVCGALCIVCPGGGAYGVVGEGELDEGDQRREPLQLCAAGGGGGGGVGGRLSTCGASAARRERASDRNSKKRVRQRRRRWHEHGGGAQMKRRAEVCVCVWGGGMPAMSAMRLVERWRESSLGRGGKLHSDLSPLSSIRTSRRCSSGA